MSWDIEAFREKVEATHTFPGNYSFKFIVPAENKQLVLDILPESKVSFKESAGGKYISVTALAKLDSTQQVLDVYMEANKINGLIAL